MDKLIVAGLILIGSLTANAQIPIYQNQLGSLGYGGLGGFGQSAGYGYNNKYGVGGVGATGTNSYGSGILPLFPFLPPPILPPPILLPPPIYPPIPPPPPSYIGGGAPYLRSASVPAPVASTAVAASSAGVLSSVVPQAVNSQPLSARSALTSTPTKSSSSVRSKR